MTLRNSTRTDGRRIRMHSAPPYLLAPLTTFVAADAVKDAGTDHFQFGMRSGRGGAVDRRRDSRVHGTRLSTTSSHNGLVSAPTSPRRAAGPRIPRAGNTVGCRRRVAGARTRLSMGLACPAHQGQAISGPGSAANHCLHRTSRRRGLGSLPAATDLGDGSAIGPTTKTVRRCRRLFGKAIKQLLAVGCRAPFAFANERLRCESPWKRPGPTNGAKI